VKIRNKLIGLAALLIVVIFMASSTVPAVNINAHAHDNAIVSGKVTSNYNSVYLSHMIKNPTNASQLLSNAFLLYYINTNEHGKSPEHIVNGMHSMSEMKTIFSSFLKSSSYARSLLALHTEHLKERFAILDKTITARLSNELSKAKSGNAYPFTSKNENTRLVSIRTAGNSPSIPGWALSSPGQYEYVVINYFTWHIYITWFAQYTITYGEQDIIYSLYTGSAAQNYYNTVSLQLGVEGLALGVLIAFLVGEIVEPVADYLGITMSSTLENGISAISGLVTGGLILATVVLDYQAIYESDYANQNSGHKYMFLYETSDYYYPWITGPESQGSSFGVTGILSNGNTINIMPVEEWFVPVPGLPTLYAQYVSNCCNSFGTGQWKYVGS
jgi:hypothetical protein